MTDQSHLWTRIDALCESLMPAVPLAVRVAERRSRELDLPAISVTPMLGRLLSVLVRLTNASRVLEVGTLGGYSTAWLATALAPGGKVVTIEVDERRAREAIETFKAGGLADRVEVLTGEGLERMGELIERHTSFDLAFLDADKENNPAYFDLALRLVRPGGVIVIDNIVRKGKILDPADPDARGCLEALRRAGASGRVTVAPVQTVGAKGHDGYLIAIVNPES
ncbi:MAG: O-methyltransferase [Phycisphaeraceae bacterium]|nr:MAG: O-methyltransferase [Phycisphaeraceae bacterium]